MLLNPMLHGHDLPQFLVVVYEIHLSKAAERHNSLVGPSVLKPNNFPY